MSNKMSFGSWPRVQECRVCGSSRCKEEPLQSPKTKFKVYCWRYGKVFFIKKSTGEIVGLSKVKTAYALNNKEQSNGQCSFEFGEDDSHLDAISL